MLFCSTIHIPYHVGNHLALNRAHAHLTDHYDLVAVIIGGNAVAHSKPLLHRAGESVPAVYSLLKKRKRGLCLWYDRRAVQGIGGASWCTTFWVGGMMLRRHPPVRFALLFFFQLPPLNAVMSEHWTWFDKQTVQSLSSSS
jgi:hypothetical protein